MKTKILFIVAFVMIICIIVGCQAKSELTYDEYINECNEGYSDYPYYNIFDSIAVKDGGAEYLKGHTEVCGDFVISDYTDGVCINQYLTDSAENEIIIPENLNGKEVVKIGAYYDESLGCFRGAFDGYFDTYIDSFKNPVITLPSTVKYLSSLVVDDVIRLTNDYITTENFSFEISADNPFYTSFGGSIFSKNMDTLLYYNSLTGQLPDSTAVFAPSNGVNGSEYQSIRFGKGLREINAEVWYEESGPYNDTLGINDFSTVYGVKGSAAEEWAIDNGFTFEALD